MDQFKVRGPNNGGLLSELYALYRIFPWIQDIVGRREVSVIFFMDAASIADYEFTECALGYNTTGQMIFRRAGETRREVSWGEVRLHRQKLRLRNPFLNSPQTELEKEDDVCIILQDHARDTDSCFDGISLVIFLCSATLKFGSFWRVTAWLAESALEQKLQEAGIPF